MLLVSEIACACGCGSLISLTDKYGRPHSYKHGHRDRKKYPNRPAKGKDHYNWKGGRSLNSQGYVVVKCEGHPKASAANRYKVREHVLVMEKHLGRYLNDNEVVHHINGIKTDNRLENLVLLKRSVHHAHHTKKRWEAGEFKDKIFNPNRNPDSGRFIKSLPR
jgi:hypothetical protein